MFVTNSKRNIPGFVKNLQKRLKQKNHESTQEAIALQLYPDSIDPKDRYIKRFIQRAERTRFKPKEIICFIKIFASVMEPMESILLVVWSQIDSNAIDEIRLLFDEVNFENAMTTYQQQNDIDQIIMSAKDVSPPHTSQQYIPLHRLAPNYEQVDLGSVVGIKDIVEEICTVIMSDDSRFVSIEGQGGIGKTTVAYSVVSRIRQTDRFKAVLWLTIGNQFSLASGKITQVGYAPILNQVGQILNVDNNNTITQILYTEPYLIIIDNIETPKDANLALTGFDDLAQGNSRFILTSRRTLHPKYSYIRSYELLPLPKEVAAKLLQLLFSRMQHSLSHEKAKEIADVSGGIPLAIHLIAGLARIESLNEIIEEICYYQAKVDDRFKKIDVMFEYVYGRIWSKLHDDVRDFLVCIALQTPIDGIPREWISVSCGISDNQLSRLLSETLGYYLITLSGLEEQMIIMHPLTVFYIKSKDNQNLSL